MSIDYRANEYVKVGNYSNVVNEIPKHKFVAEGTSTLQSLLDKLVYKLSLRHPEWQFVGEDSWYDHMARTFLIKRLRVYEGDDELGSLLVDTWRDEKFEIRNARINNAMAKRNHKSTKDVDKAVKIVEQFFSSKSLSERLAEGRSKVSSAISTKSWSAGREFDTVMGKLAPALATYVTQHMAEVRPVLEAYGAPAAALDMLTEKRETRILTASVFDAHNNARGTTVLLYGDRYILIRDDEPVILAASQLDADTRGKLGVLKIVDDNDVIESVGMRVNSTTFYLLP